MELNKELEVLKSYMGGKNPEKFEKQAVFIRENFTSESDRSEIDKFIESELFTISNRVENCIKESEIRLQLLDIKEIVSLSYIAKHYFKKTRFWLHQKINGNIKNGKPCAFTDDELSTLNFALQDISKKIGSIAIYS
jgi:hypothetical protein